MIKDKNFRPGTIGYHEIVDRTFLIMTMFEYVRSHPSRKVTPRINKKVKRVFDDLFDLYQELACIPAEIEQSHKRLKRKSRKKKS